MSERDQRQGQSPAEDATNPAVVYDRVTKIWQLLLGEDLHFGYFENSRVPLAAATAKLTSEMAGWAEIHRNMQVLDIGCGIGGPALFLAQQFGCHVTGITTSQVGVGIAASRAAAADLGDRAEFLERDGMANGLPMESFDRAWIMESSHLMERKDLLLAESARVLRPDGRLVLCDVVVKQEIPFQYLVRNLSEFENLNAVFGKQHVELLSTYRDLAERNGLKVERTTDISEAVLPTLENWRRNAKLHGDKVSELAGGEYLDQFIRACVFLERLWREEKLGYGMMLAARAS